MAATKVELFDRVRHDSWREGLSVRGLARKYGVHRRLVREALAYAEPAPRKTPVRRSPQLEPLKEIIDGWLRADLDAPRKQRHTTGRIHARLVDENMRAAPGVWAIGDVVRKGEYTHMSLYHGRIILSQPLGRPYHPAEYHAVPRVTFTDPEIGAVGPTEAQARERLGGKVSTAIRQIPPSPRGRIRKAGNDGFIKLVVDSERGILAGATSAGPDGGEVLSMLTLAVHAAVPVQRLREMIHPYPTFHGAVPEATGRLT